MSNRINRFHDETVGSKFLAIDNRDLIATLERAMPGQAIEILKPRGHNNSGIMAKISLPDLSFNVPELGGLHVPNLFLRNANDGGLALTVGVGLFRALCLNGLYSGFAAFGAKIKHVDGPKAHGVLDILPDTLISAVKDIESGAVIDTAMECLETRIVDPIDIVGSLPGVSLRTKDRVIDAIALGSHRPEDRPETAWGLYNLVNEAAKQRSRSLYRAAVNDIGLMENILFLASHQKAA